MKDESLHLIRALPKEERVAAMRKHVERLAHFIKDVPPFDEESCRCLSCGRLVLVGRCCGNPRYKDNG